MRIRFKTKSFLLGGLVSAAIAFGLGCFFLLSRNHPSDFLAWTSYDLSFDFSHYSRPNVGSSNVVIVYIDEKTFRDFGASESELLDRQHYADLLKRLHEDGTRATAMDIVFSDKHPGYMPLESDWHFTQLLQKNGRVVLGVDFNAPREGEARPFMDLPAYAVETKAIDQVLVFPYKHFRYAAAKLGMVLLIQDQDRIIRQHWSTLDSSELRRIFPEDRSKVPPSLSLATAELCGIHPPENSPLFTSNKWIYYYGKPGEAIPGISLSTVASMPPGFFTNKIVFVGALPMTSPWNELRDEARSPYNTYGYHFTKMPLVEVHATEFLNLMRGDWLKRFKPGIEIAILLLTSIGFGFGLLRYRPLMAAIVAVLGVVGVIVFEQAVFVGTRIWFPWLIIAIVQAPATLLCSIVYRSLEWYRQRKLLELQRQRAYERIREQAALLDKAQDAIIVHDLDWRVQYWNKSAENLYGWSSDEVHSLNL
jgi:CHASE2 domain-containing sensor protein